MAGILDLVNTLDKSIQSSLLETDPCYTTIRDSYQDIIQFIADTKSISVDTVVGTEREYLILLAKKEVFLRLAVSVAPEYNVELEYTKILKSDRFTHYIKLVETVEKDIVSFETSTGAGMPTISMGEVAPVIIDGRDGTIRNYEHSVGQTISPTFVKTSNHIDISWNVFDIFTCGRFAYYKVYYGTESFYDQFAETEIDSTKVINSFVLYDMLKPRYRLQNLAPATSYRILIEFAGKNGRKSYSYTTQVTTA